MAHMTNSANFKHGSQTLLTPIELKKLTKSLLDPGHEEFGEPGSQYQDSNHLYWQNSSRWGASGECEKTSRWIHPYLPQGSQIVNMNSSKEDSWVDEGGQRRTASRGNHYVNVVPTTEGPHVVDFTHRQFQNSAGLPVVQHINDFMTRSSMKGYILDQDQLSPELQKNLGE